MNLRSFTTLISLMLLGILASGQLYMSIPVVKTISAYFQVAPEKTAWMSTAFGLAYATGFLIWGPASDRYGRKKTLLVGIILAFLATICAAIAKDYNSEIVARVAQGLFAAVIPPVALAIISEMLNDRWRPVGQSMMGFSFIASAPVAQFYANQLAMAGFGVHTMMMYCALAFAILGGIIWLVAPVKHDTGNHRKNALHKSFKELSRDPVVLTVWACAFTALTGFIIFQTLVSGALGGNNISQVEIRAYTLLGMFASFATGFLIRAWGDVNILRLGLGVSSITLLSSILLDIPLPFEIVMLSVGVALSIPGIISIISRRASHADRGMGIAIYSFCLFVGASISPVLAKLTAPSVTHTLLMPICIISIAFISLWMPWVNTKHQQ